MVTTRPASGGATMGAERSLLPIALLTALLACTAPPQGPSYVLEDGSEVYEPDGVSITVGDIPTVVQVSWSTDRSGTSWVEYGLEDAWDRATPTRAVATKHQATLLGLKAGRNYRLRTVTLIDGEPVLSEEGSVEVPPPPPELVGFHLVHREPGLDPGYVLASVVGVEASQVVILDRDGDVVWWRDAGPDKESFTPAPGRHGPSILYLAEDNHGHTDLNAVCHISLDGSEEVRTSAPQGHHAFWEAADGRIAHIRQECRRVTPEGAQEPELVCGDQLVVVPEGSAGEGAQVLFSFWEDWPDPPVPDSATGDTEPWTWVNSLARVGDTYLLNSRNLDSLLGIDAHTGELLWVLGGVHNEFDGPDQAFWSHGHFSHAWEGGLVLFDNGVASGHTRVLELALDVEARTVQPVWIHHAEAFHVVGGDVRVMPSGHYLVSWSPAGRVSELTPEHEVVWELEMDMGHGIGRVVWIEDLYELL